MTPNGHDPVATVIGALCTDGPIVDAFGIKTSLSEEGTAAHLASEFLHRMAGNLSAFTSASHDLDDTTVRLGDLVEPARAELEDLPLDSLGRWVSGAEGPLERSVIAERYWRVFAPDSAGIEASGDERVLDLRRRRLVTVKPGSNTDAGGRILFTSNVLLTSPDAGDEQLWFYDHPMVIGADLSSSEIVHGLVGIDEAMAFEKLRGTLDASTTVDCVLSVSVTHESLADVAAAEVFRHVEACGDLEHLSVFVFTEADTDRLAAEVLEPAVGCRPGQLTVFGVNGNYGRHYSFLKAIAALWQTVVDPVVDRTFKFDLDQVFPQRELVATTGQSALELLTAGGNWGAGGIDDTGGQVHLGMCAGALVNRSDIDRGLFTPDVELPTGPSTLPDLMFRKAVPQSLSTEAEMMDRGDDPPGAVRQRVHVTGGTTGITVNALVRFRPFTPSFIARAEDQAYLFSVLGGPEPRLRTVHIPGLFMRYDKAAVAAGAVTNAEVDTAIGDYERTLLFTGYARAIAPEETSWLGPFTGYYISETPLAVTLIRLMLDVIDRSNRGDTDSATRLLVSGVQRIGQAYDLALAPGNRLRNILEDERSGWDRYYAAVEALTQRPDLVNRAQEIIATTRFR